MNTNRIDKTFERLRAKGETGVSAFLTVGYPDVASTLKLVPALVEGGADLVELGVPFSDPLADGATIQHSSQVALANGITLSACLDTCHSLRKTLPDTPFVLMGYYNPFFAYGLDRFARDAASSGVDGVIIPDLPPEEAAPLNRACLDNSLDLIFFLAPTSTDERMKKVAQVAWGFIYCVSLAGVTGARKDLPPDLSKFIARVKSHTTLPLAVGFGVSTGDQVKAIGKFADAVIVGSALLNAIDSAPPGRRVESARAFIAALKGKP